MHHTAHLLHPSQTVMSYFKEPQRAVSGIQRIMDGLHPACALLADLSKAFERINPHWILYLLRFCGAPRWFIAYTGFVLFRRRVTHKVQGRLLPSRCRKLSLAICNLADVPESCVFRLKVWINSRWEKCSKFTMFANLSFCASH